jgi:hypothetical protein
VILKQSFPFKRKFLMVLSSDHNTGATGKTVTVKLSKGDDAAGVTANGVISELDSTNLPGMYQVALTAIDTANINQLGYNCTASGCDTTTFFDSVQANVFTDLNMDASGAIAIKSAIKQNSAVPFFPFTMTVAGVPTAGLTVTGTRNFGSGFSPISGAISDSGNGTYKANLLAADTNSPSIMFRFVAGGADDRDIAVFTTP